MGLMNLFRPKWKHSDYRVRIAAIKELTDQVLLADIVRTDENARVRRDAVEKLTDQHILAEVAKTDKDKSVREKAVKTITDGLFLAEITKADPEEFMRRAAMAALERFTCNDALLMDIARNAKDADVRRAAVKKITDQVLLADIAGNAKDVDVRRDAVEKLTDQHILAEVAKTDKDESVRENAVKKIRDEVLLAEIAKADPEEFMRRAAMVALAGLFCNDALLMDIAKNAKDADVRRTAVKKIRDEVLLAQIAKTDPEEFMCNYAVERLTDWALLTDVAKNASESGVRKAAVKRLTDLRILAEERKAKLEAIQQKPNINYLTEDDLSVILKAADHFGDYTSTRMFKETFKRPEWSDKGDDWYYYNNYSLDDWMYEKRPFLELLIILASAETAGWVRVGPVLQANSVAKIIRDGNLFHDLYEVFDDATLALGILKEIAKKDKSAEKESEEFLRALESTITSNKALRIICKIEWLVYLGDSALTTFIEQLMAFLENVAARRENIFEFIVAHKASLDPESLRIYVRLVKIARKRGQNIIADLMDLMKDTGTPGEERSLDVNQSIRSAMESNPGRGQAKIVLKLSEGLPDITAPRWEIGFIWRNLIVSVIETMEEAEGKEITIQTRATSGKVEIEVSDNGPGISCKIMPNIFDERGIARLRGAGFGFAYIKKIVEKYNGAIIVKSEPGKGTTFTVSLPSAKKPR